MTRTIDDICREVGIPRYVLRFLESQFDDVKPERDAEGEAFYSEDKIALIHAISQLLYEENYTINGTQELLENYGAATLVQVWYEQQEKNEPIQSAARLSKQHHFETSDENRSNLYDNQQHPSDDRDSAPEEAGVLDLGDSKDSMDLSTEDSIKAEDGGETDALPDDLPKEPDPDPGTAYDLFETDSNTEPDPTPGENDAPEEKGELTRSGQIAYGYNLMKHMQENKKAKARRKSSPKPKLKQAEFPYFDKTDPPGEDSSSPDLPPQNLDSQQKHDHKHDHKKSERPRTRQETIAQLKRIRAMLAVALEPRR